ncbi:MAG: hypothetical protein R3E87_09465 [Burkholderiaceae bacterium]
MIGFGTRVSRPRIAARWRAIRRAAKRVDARVAVLLLACLPGACAYLEHVAIQSEYERLQHADPRQIILKHMVERDTFFVVGQTNDTGTVYTGVPLAVAAYSSKFKPHELVDTMVPVVAGTHFGLNLPAGDFDLLVFADLNADRVFDSAEVVGQARLSLNRTTVSDKILDRIGVELSSPRRIAWADPIAAPAQAGPRPSLFYPTGSIRSLDDPLFDSNMATLGMYDPASFLERAPTMFYALEEDLPYKIPVVFVHGAGGSARDFEPIVSRLDRNRYKPWFFYYPSGGDLDQLAELFHRIFLSGTVIDLVEMPMVIVAHSMGGLIVREALNKVGGRAKETRVGLLVTIASPFGGHPSAALGEKHGMLVLPAWRDLNPDSRFIGRLFRKPLPDSVRYHLLYAYDNPSAVKLSKNSDGVVPLSSQLRPEAQREAARQLGLESGHADVLANESMIAHLFGNMGRVENFFPESHLRVLRLGGYDVPLSEGYSPIMRYIVANLGRYWMAISKGVLEPIHPEQERFVRAVRGEEPPSRDVVREWIRFLGEHPGIDDDPRPGVRSDQAQRDAFVCGVDCAAPRQ